MQEATVVIPNYNGIAYIERCLNALRKQSISAFHIIVVDNGSTDGSSEIIKSCYTEVELIAFNENTGFCKAVNAGIKQAKTPYIILLNNDTEAEEQFVEELLKAVKRSPRIFSCSAKMLDFYKRNMIDDAGNMYCALGWAYARGKGRSDQYYNKYCKVFSSCAGAAIYKKSVFDEIGLFDERHFAYLEDIDIGYRARIFGYENRYAPDARVYHIGSATSGSRYNELKVRLSARNNIYLIYKNMPVLQFLINLPLILLGIFIKLLFFIKKRLGMAYLSGILNGLTLCKRDHKVKFCMKHLPCYFQIQLELWNNMIVRIPKR